MTSMIKAPISIALALAGTAHAAQVDCYTNPRTDAMQCIDARNVRESGGIRFTKLYSGGPNGVRDTGFSIHANCKSGVVHLKDRDGVSFAGGTGNETEAIRTLRSLVCNASVRK